MNRFAVFQFYGLLKREVLEHRNLFIGAPAVVALLILVASTWVAMQIDENQLAEGLRYVSVLFDGLSPFDMAPFFMLMAVPFFLTLYVCSVIYLINTLYQDRKEMSVLFWQSMPVSNLQTVLSKIAAIVLVAPIFYVLILFAMYLIAMVWLTILGISNDVGLVGIGYMFLAAIASLILIYISAIVTFLWLLPSVGWLLLFSAFAKKTPLLWAGGVFILVGFFEDFIFGTQYLANWVASRVSDPNQYLIFEFQNVFERIFNYDTLFGIVIGAILIAGAVFMRRFTD
jgi:ABC-2 type transport system permease protein